MNSNALIIQASVAIPIALGLSLYTLIRRDRSALHLLMSALLGMVAIWLGAMVVKLTAEPLWLKLAAFHIEFFTTVYMAPLFLVMMGYFARTPIFEQSRAATISVFAVSTSFYFLYLSDPVHGLFFSNRDAAIAGAAIDQWAGPLYWGFQIWCQLCNTISIGFCLNLALRGRTNEERGRSWITLAAILAPILGHVIYLMEVLPIDYSLAPIALGVSAIFFVQGVHRYGLLEVQPIVRHDVIEHLVDGVVLADGDGIVLDANAAAEDVLRCSRSEIRGVSLQKALALLEPSNPHEPFVEELELLCQKEGRISLEVHAKDGRWVEITGSAVAAVGMQPAGIVVSLRDRTIQRRNERLLRERQKLESIGTLAAGVAHEVNNPLAYVRANMVHLQDLAQRVVKRMDRDVDEPESYAGQILESPEILAESIEGLDRIKNVVESMLRFSRFSDEESRPVDVNVVIEESLRLARLHQKSAVAVECEVPEGLPTIMGSAERLVQVILNLVLNAKQALAETEDGRITASASVEGKHVVIAISDNGPGIPDELQEKIFDPFFTTRPPDEGTGLGLSIAFDIVQEHGGALEVESQLGVGSRFSVKLPIEADALRPGMAD